MLNKISGLARALYIMLAVVTAFVALGMPFMLQCDAAIHSRCMQCQDEVTVHIRSEKVVHHSPAGLVVWLPTVQG